MESNGGGSNAGDNKIEQQYVNLEEEVKKLDSFLGSIEKAVVESVKANLKAKAECTWVGPDDAIFACHTLYVQFCLSRLFSDRAIRLWVCEIEPEVAKAEIELKQRNPQARIHKGAPLYNVGLCFFPDRIESSLRYIAQAGIEEELSGHANRKCIVIGDNALSEQILLKTIVAWVETNKVWGDIYLQTTGCTLNKDELKDLLNGLSCSHFANAVQTILALHRFAGVQLGPDNEVSRHLRVQALVNLALVLESSLRTWQTGITGELYERLKQMLSITMLPKSAFDGCHSHFCNRFPSAHPDRKTVAAVNWAIDECLNAFTNASTTGERAGIACYLVYQLRNSIMHVIDDSLSLYADQGKLLTVMGLVLSSLRISRLGAEGQIGSLR